MKSVENMYRLPIIHLQPLHNLFRRNAMISDTINIRRADSTSAGELGDLIRNAFRDVAQRFNLNRNNCPKHPSNCTTDWVRKDFSRGVAYFVLEIEDRPAGCAAIEKAEPGLFYLERLAVLPEYRRRGFGKALLNHAVGAARELGAKRIGIGIIAEDKSLRDWYAGLGFIAGDTKAFSHLPFLVLLMSLDI